MENEKEKIIISSVNVLRHTDDYTYTKEYNVYV